MSIAIRLAPEIEDKLTSLAKKTHRSKSFYVREAIVSYLEEMEDYYLALEALDNPGRLLSLEEARKFCGLGD